MRGEGHRPHQFTREETERILDRLIELDRARAGGLTSAEILEVARELEIPPSLARRAILEELDGPESTLGRGAALRARLSELLIFGSLGAGAFAPTMLTGVSHLPGILGVGAISVALGLDSRRKDAWRRFSIRNVGLWTGFVAGGSALFAMSADISLALVIGLPLLAGGAVLSVGRWLAARSRGNPGAGVRGSARVGSKALARLRSMGRTPETEAGAEPESPQKRVPCLQWA